MRTYSVSEIPFSSPGSFLTITQAPGSPERLLYRTVSGRAARPAGLDDHAGDFFEIALIQNGVEIPYTWIAQPHRLDLLGEGDLGATMIFLDGETLMIEAQGVGLRLKSVRPFEAITATTPNQVALTDYHARGFHLLRAVPGATLEVRETARSGSSFQPVIEFHGPAGTLGALRFTPHEHFWTDPLPDFTDTVELRSAEYTAWAAKMPQVQAEYRDTAELAWFLLWNVQVPAGGALTRPALYTTKSAMNAVWAWDNCFNALAVVGADPDLAWSQLLLFFEQQNQWGMVPNMVTDLEAVFGFTKPPVQGWTIRKLVLKTGMKAALPYLEQIYKPLANLTEWWYTQRDPGGSGMPLYHHASDSGWDNATLFDPGSPIAGADLAAHLVLQCEALAFIANMLGKNKASNRWFERAQQQLQTLLAKGVRDNRFISPPAGGLEHDQTNQSLLNYIPLVLGGRLPSEILDTLIVDLEPGGPFLTNWGLATESPFSPLYEADGDWRGPVWAPSTYLIFDGLVDAGKFDYAHVIAQRYCDSVMRDPGFWENYDALTGQGLGCPGYSWTAAVFLLMAEWLATMNGA